MRHNYFIKSLIGALVFFSLIFVSAGRLDYMPGILYTSIGIIMLIVGNTWLKLDDDLLAERARPGANTKSWDKQILILSLLATLAMYIVAGLDSGRFGWSPAPHWSITLIGAILTITGQLLFLIAQKQNRFFSSTVRIQTDRGHTVCDTGLYQVVRHPAYMGSLIQLLGFPLLFGSIWSLIPVGISLILLIVRTYREDYVLYSELGGYREYTEKTRYRLIPYIW